jgi:F-type H+-transporting ATPase subunit c
MSKLYAAVMLTFIFLLFASPLFAQAPAATAATAQAPAATAATDTKPAATGTNLDGLTAGFAMAIASSFCGLAQGKAISSACEGLARNPGAAPAIRASLLLGLVLIESLAIYTLFIILLKFVLHVGG